MYRTINPQNITYVWNNSEGLMGNDISFIILRTMVKLPFNNPEIGEIINIKGENMIESISWTTTPKVVMGKLVVDFSYQPFNWDKAKLVEEKMEREFDKSERLLRNNKNVKNKEETIFSSITDKYKIDVYDKNVVLNFIIPYRALIKSQKVGEIDAQVKFIHARQVGLQRVLIEAVIALTSLGYFPWREEGYTETFSNASLMTINEDLPDIKEPLTSQVRFIISDQKLEDGLLTISGLKEICLMYIGERTTGEKVIIARHFESFTENILLTDEMQFIGPMEIINDNLKTSLINKREVLIEGNYILKIIQTPFMGEVVVNAKEPVVEPLKPEIKPENNLPEKETSETEKIDFSENTQEIPLETIGVVENTEEKIESDEDNIEICKDQVETDYETWENNNRIETGEIVVLSRESKRAKLSKHMRKLKK
ncbi:MAG: hypothetical protein PWQ67_117 [Clostridia bacterium]|jgi:hypothetical protein|nr:hypothetical protein [Clostridia bacterium]MDN5321663.1 hypothetical protein [Clostridia bacterium]